jgi:HlyD family secretion protein
MKAGSKAWATSKELLKASGVMALLIVLMMWLSGAFVQKVSPGPPLPKGEPPSLKTTKVELKTFPLILEQVGTLKTQREAHVSSRIMAQVREILVREGDEVIGPSPNGPSPTIMAKLDDRDIQAKVRQAESQLQAIEKATQSARSRLKAAHSQADAAQAELERASRDFGRTEELFKSKAATGQQLEHAKAQRDIAEARHRAALQEVEAIQSEIRRIEAQRNEVSAALAEAKVMLSHTVITAPFSGRVTRKMVEVGDMVAPGKPMFLVETALEPEIHALVSESLVPLLQVGQRVQVRVDSLEEATEGVVREIVPSADPATRTVLVKVSIPRTKGLVSGLFARIGVPAGSYKALVVPQRAVREVGQLHFVEVKGEDGHPQRRFVTLGSRHGEMVEILSGLKEGEEVVLP